MKLPEVKLDSFKSEPTNEDSNLSEEETNQQTTSNLLDSDAESDSEILMVRTNVSDLFDLSSDILLY